MASGSTHSMLSYCGQLCASRLRDTRDMAPSVMPAGRIVVRLLSARVEFVSESDGARHVHEIDRVSTIFRRQAADSAGTEAMQRSQFDRKPPLIGVLAGAIVQAIMARIACENRAAASFAASA